MTYQAMLWLSLEEYIILMMKVNILTQKKLIYLKKVIYSDIDVTFVGDIKNLYMESLDNKIIGAVPSQRGKLNNNYEEIKKKLKLSDSHHFFSSSNALMKGFFKNRNS